MSFDDHHPFTKPDKKTDYTYEGRQITLTKRPGRPRIYRNPLFVPQETKLEAAALYAVLGDVAKVAELAKVSEKQIRDWQKEPFWTEIQIHIAHEGNTKFLSKINSTVEEALKALEDRIIRGDCKIIPAVPERKDADGNVIQEAIPEREERTPIKARDLAQIFHALTHQKQLMEGKATTITQGSTTESTLKLLQERFTSFANSTIDGNLKVIEETKES